MKFMLFIRNDETFQPPPALEPEVIAWVAEAKSRGGRISGSRFRPLSEAQTVRIRGDNRSLAQESRAETENRITGYELVDCANIDEAIELAAAHPMASIGSVEIRPLWVL
jgi:hypothetical protein